MSDGEVVQLKEYFETRLTATRELFEAKLQAVQNNLDAFIFSNEQRLEKMNEIRGAMEDQSLYLQRQTEKFLTKEEYVVRHSQLEKDSRELRESRAREEGKNSRAVLISVASLTIALMAFIGHVFHLM